VSHPPRGGRRATVRPAAGRPVYGSRHEVAGAILEELEASRVEGSVRAFWGCRALRVDLASKTVTAQQLPAAAAARGAGAGGVLLARPAERAGSMESARSDTAPRPGGEGADPPSPAREPSRGRCGSDSTSDGLLYAHGDELTLGYDLLVGADGVHSVVRDALEAQEAGFEARLEKSSWGYFTARTSEPSDFLLPGAGGGPGRGSERSPGDGWTHVLPGARAVPSTEGPEGRGGGSERPTMMVMSSLRGVARERARAAGRGCRVVVLGPERWAEGLTLRELERQWGDRVRPGVLEDVFEQIAAGSARRQTGLWGDPPGPREGAPAPLEPFGGGYHLWCSRLCGDGVALVGDSAHSMSPSLGLGCNAALESAVALSDSLRGVRGGSEAGLQAALARYSEARLPDALAATDVSVGFVRNRDRLVLSTMVLALASRAAPFLFRRPVLFELRGSRPLSEMKAQLDRTVRDAALAVALVGLPLAALALVLGRAAWTLGAGPAARALALAARIPGPWPSAAGA